MRRSKEERHQLAEHLLALMRQGLSQKDAVSQVQEKDKDRGGRGFSEASASRWISEYRRTSHKSGERNAELEEQLLASYRGLTDAIVVNMPEDLTDVAIHHALGRVAGEYLRRSLRRNDRIGVSGGRAVFYSAANIKAQNPQLSPRQRGIEVVPLCADLDDRPVGPYSGGEGQAPSYLAVGSMVVAEQFAAAFGSSVDERFEYGTVALPKRGPRPWRGRVWDERYKPTLAICGVGVMVEGNHFEESAKHDVPVVQVVGELKDLKKAKDAAMKDVEKAAVREAELDGMKRFTRALRGLRFEHALVGDLMNELFFIPPPPIFRAQPIATRKEKRLKELIQKVNDKMVTCGISKLKEIGEVLVVSGGNHKFCALAHLLTSGPLVEGAPLVTRLCTDSINAQRLIRCRQFLL